MDDVLIVGAGPAGSVAAAILARAGLRVRIVDRATFPRDKLCGDTINPGTLARLRHLRLAEAIDRDGLRVDGMLVTGDSGRGAHAGDANNVVIHGQYPGDLHGRSLSRSILDWTLLQQAIDAGAIFEPGVAVASACISETRQGPMISGVTLDSRGATRSGGTLAGRVTIAADGRHSTLAFGLGLARHPGWPRRWAVGAYFEGAQPDSSSASLSPGASLSPNMPTGAPSGVVGEMHIRRGRYIGVAPLPGGITNVCVVAPTSGSIRRDGHRARDGRPEGLGEFRDPAALIRRELERDERLRDRFAGARLVRPPIVLGPLAVDAGSRSVDGLLLAGDAAGFIDPMTGDGMRFAVRGAELAAAAAIDALEHGWSGVHDRLAEARRAEFASKCRFNRALRRLVGAPLAVRIAAAGARLSPGLVKAIIARAGDCHLAEDTLAPAPTLAVAD